MYIKVIMFVFGELTVFQRKTVWICSTLRPINTLPDMCVCVRVCVCVSVGEGAELNDCTLY